MLEALAILHHPLGQMLREQIADRRHYLVAKMVRQERQAITERVEPSLHRKHQRQAIGAEVVEREERVLAVLLRDIESDAVQIFARDRQCLERGQHMAADLFELLGIVRANVENASPLLLRKRV